MIDASASDSDYACAWDFAELQAKLQSQAAEDTDHHDGGLTADNNGVKSVPVNSPTSCNMVGATQTWAPGTLCIGKYNFPGSAKYDLPFRKRDELEIIAPSRDPNWYKAKRSDGLEGMIPFNYVQKIESNNSTNDRGGKGGGPDHPMGSSGKDVLKEKGAVKLHTMPWFHGNIGREDAEKLLGPLKNGLFLVRESRAYKGDYTLSVCYDGKVQHFRVRRNDRNWVTVDDEEYFENLVKLVEHHQKEADGLCCRLKYSVEKTGSHDFVVDTGEFKRQGWAIPRADLDIKNKIGQGEFGEMWMGEYKGRKVAIKSMKEIKSAQATQQLLAEASIMTTLQHNNLVGLIGVSLDGSPIYLVTEFMEKGSLVDYLRNRGRAVISKVNLLAFSRHVCNGMVYLESRNIIHRDLAAHNVFLSDDGTAKVSNFCLAREGSSRTDSQKLPVKWTAPEALNDNKFSNKSDVWSFGIFLWELYSYGRVPYPGVPVNDISQYIEKGYRMDAPDGCPDSVYSVMKECWEADPTNRPNFTELLDSVLL